MIGVSNPRWGEVPLAIIVPQGRDLPVADELHAFCRERLAGFKVPTHFHFTGEIPRNPSGKILKQQLRNDIGKDYDQ